MPTVAPTHAYPATKLAENDLKATNPWAGRIDGALARTLGFRPEVRTIHQAIQEGLL